MNKVPRVLLVFSLLSAISLFFPACQEEKVPEGQLPVYQVGDKWVLSYVMEGKNYTVTEEIIGEETVEDRDCYVVDMSFDPVIESTVNDMVYTVTSMRHWMDKGNVFLEINKMETSYSGDGLTYTTSEIYTCDAWAPVFPLEIGKEVELKTTKTRYLSGSQMGKHVTTTKKHVVASREDVTVAVGTFNCWKIIIYDVAGSVTETTWYSDYVEFPVKITDGEGNIKSELISYSLVRSI